MLRTDRIDGGLERDQTPMMSLPIITFTTDFGADSHYVAQMKAVVLGIEPTAKLIDITHSIRPQQVIGGAVVMADSCPVFPPGTIHVGVVDPGVGTQRKVIAVSIGAHTYITPDNGLLSLVASQARLERIIHLNRNQYWRRNVSRTFHGRDIMAPVAAHLARGVPLHELGDSMDHIVMLENLDPIIESNTIRGRCLLVDAFGNLITNIVRCMLPQNLHSATVMLLHRSIPFVETYGDAQTGSLVALFGSSGRLEIAEVQGNAARTLNAGTDCLIKVSW